MRELFFEKLLYGKESMSFIKSCKLNILLAAAGLAFVFLIFGFAGIKNADAAVASEGKIYLENINVTGMTQDEVQAVIDSKMEKYGQGVITFYVGDSTCSATAKELGLYYANTDLAATIASAGLNGNILERYRIDEYIKNNGAVFFSLDLKVNYDNVYSIVSERCAALNKAPVDMQMGRNEDGTFYTVPKVNGYNVLVDDTVNAVCEYLNSSWHGGEGGIKAITETVEAQGVEGDDISLISSILGTGVTAYTQSDEEAARCKNLEVGASKINGTILYPGEEFSTENALVPFTAENGYYEAASYENGTVVDSIGGGICQVSSTLYRAVLEAELEVTERYQHSMIVGYVEPSMDATIAEGSLDFKFINTTDAPIYIEGWAKDGQVYFAIYGHETRSPSHSISFASEILSEEEASTVYSYDYSLPWGTIEKTDAHKGMSARAFKITYENGVEVSREQISSSTYIKSDGQVIIGMAGAPEGAADALAGPIAANNLGYVYILLGLDGDGSALETPRTFEEAKAIVAAAGL